MSEEEQHYTEQLSQEEQQEYIQPSDEPSDQSPPENFDEPPKTEPTPFENTYENPTEEDTHYDRDTQRTSSEPQADVSEPTPSDEPQGLTEPMVNTLSSRPITRGREGGRDSTRGTSNSTSRTPSRDRTQRSSTSRSRSRDRRSSASRNFLDPTDTNLDHVIEKYTRSPGPAYNTGPIKDQHILRRSFHAFIPTEPRDKHFAPLTISPGPAYLPDPEKLSSHPKSPRATFGTAKTRTSMEKEKTEGCGLLAPIPLEKIKKRAFRANFGTSKRETTPSSGTPGPSDYAPQAKHKTSSSRGTFSGQERGSANWIFM